MNNNPVNLENKPNEDQKKRSILRLSLKNFGVGGIASLIGTFVLTSLFFVILGFWDVFFIFVVVFVSLVSIPIGGIGGIICGNIWNSRKAVIIGGIICGMLIPIFFAVFFTCPFFGGC